MSWVCTSALPFMNVHVCVVIESEKNGDRAYLAIDASRWKLREWEGDVRENAYVHDRWDVTSTMMQREWRNGDNWWVWVKEKERTGWKMRMSVAFLWRWKKLERQSTLIQSHAYTSFTHTYIQPWQSVTLHGLHAMILIMTTSIVHHQHTHDHARNSAVPWWMSDVQAC